LAEKLAEQLNARCAASSALQCIAYPTMHRCLMLVCRHLSYGDSVKALWMSLRLQASGWAVKAAGGHLNFSLSEALLGALDATRRDPVQNGDAESAPRPEEVCALHGVFPTPPLILSTL
jgi:hypothetical protein